MNTYRLDYEDRSDRRLEQLELALARIWVKARLDEMDHGDTAPIEVLVAAAKLQHVRQQLAKLKSAEELEWVDAKQNFERAKLEFLGAAQLASASADSARLA